MEYRQLGNTGITVSALGFGCGAVGGLMTRGDGAAQRAAVARAIEGGVTYFDTAQQYGEGRSEENLGRVLRELDAWDRVKVGTKLFLRRSEFGDAQARARELMQVSLDRLGRDAVDLIQLHGRIVDEPGGDSPTADEAIEIVSDALAGLVQAGLAGHAGFTGLGDTAAMHRLVGSGKLETVQCYFNALNPSGGYAGASNGAQDFDALIDAAAVQGMGAIGIRVLAGGAASGTAERAANASPMAGSPPMTPGGEFDADVQRANALAGIAADAGITTTAELAFRFALAKPGLSTALIGFSNGEQLEEALAWAERGPLDASIVARIVEGAR